jgi:hypothetical protein
VVSFLGFLKLYLFFKDAHVNLVGGISANHVQDGEAAAGMAVDPFAKVESVALVDDNGLALLDEELDGVGGEERRRHGGLGGSEGSRESRVESQGQCLGQGAGERVYRQWVGVGR